MRARPIRYLLLLIGSSKHVALCSAYVFVQSVDKAMARSQKEPFYLGTKQLTVDLPKPNSGEGRGRGKGDRNRQGGKGGRSRDRRGDKPDGRQRDGRDRRDGGRREGRGRALPRAGKSSQS